MRVRIRQVVLMLIQTALATTALLSPDAASALTISSITRSSSPFPTDECGVAVSQDARALVVLGLGHDNAFWMLRQDGGAFEPTWRSLGGQFASGPALVRLPHGDGVAVFGSTAEGRVQTATVRPSAPSSLASALPTRAPGWLDLGGEVTMRPQPLLDARGLLHVFALGRYDRAVHHKRQAAAAGGGDAAWGRWEVLSGAISSAPHPVLDAEGWIHVFARGVRARRRAPSRSRSQPSPPLLPTQARSRPSSSLPSPPPSPHPTSPSPNTHARRSRPRALAQSATRGGWTRRLAGARLRRG